MTRSGDELKRLARNCHDRVLVRVNALSVVRVGVLREVVEIGSRIGRQQPGAAVGTAESSERFERSQIRLLHHILRILFVAKQPSG